MPAQPLSALLSRVWVAIVIEIDNAVEASTPPDAMGRFRISYAMWANALRFVDAATTVQQIEDRAGARVNVPGLERWGWLAIGDRRRGDAGFGTSRGVTAQSSIVPTRAARSVARLWPDTIAAVEARWRDRFGGGVVDDLRVSAQPDAAGRPWSLPEIHPAGGFCTQVRAGAAAGGGPQPLVAALAGALTAVTLRHEARTPVALPLSANFLDATAETPVRIRDLPARTGLSKECVAMSVTVLRTAGLLAETAEHHLSCTAAGLEALTAARTHAEAGDPRLRSALEDVLAQTDALRDGLRPPAGCWRGAPPYLLSTKRFLADPARALPRQPMPLHRGGWPDGS